MAKKWIAGAIKKKGALRKALSKKKGQKITINELGIASTDTTLMKRRKNLARTLAKLRRK